MNTPAWTPSATRVAASQLTRFAAFAHARHGAPAAAPLDDPAARWAALWQWSIDQRAAFWSALVEFTGIRAEHGKGEVLVDGDRMPGARWFTGMRLNYAENLLGRRDAHAAIVFRDERGTRRVLSHLDLHARVARVAAGLAAAGVGPGDVVAGMLPNLPEAVIAMLATASRGGIWTCCPPQLDTDAVVARFGQVRPKVLFIADGHFRSGKSLDSLAPVAACIDRMGSIERVVVVPYASPRPDIGRVPRAVLLGDFERDGPLAFQRMAFDAPLQVSYAQSAPGVPTCVVHGLGGTLLQQRKEHVLHTDLRSDDTLFVLADCGSMMWNWLVAGLACGATIVLYDGSPLHPAPGVLWEIVAKERVTAFGADAGYFAALEQSGYRPNAHHKLVSLRTILPTGSPLSACQCDFAYGAIAADAHLAALCDDADIGSCPWLGNPWLPVRRGEAQCSGLGMAVEVWDEAGQPIRGRRGEIVCTRAFPSLPVGLWNDPAGTRYRATYFERFPNVWHHAAGAMLGADGTAAMPGRPATEQG